MKTLFIRYGRKIWLTEFAVANTHDKQKVIDFVKVSIRRFLFSCDLCKLFLGHNSETGGS